jgi:hypothetical protein
MSAICLGDVFTKVLRTLLGNRCFTKAICAIGSTATKIKTTTNTVQYCIDGQLYEKSATDDLFVFSDVSVQPVSTTCFYALCLNAAGDASVVNGEPVSTAAITAGTSKALFPEVPETVCVVGGVKVETDSTHTFTPGSTALSAAGITDTYYNFSCIPTAGLA